MCEKRGKNFFVRDFYFGGGYLSLLKLFGGVIPTSPPPLGRLCLEDQYLQNHTWNLKLTCMPIFLTSGYTPRGL